MSSRSWTRSSFRRKASGLAVRVRFLWFQRAEFSARAPFLALFRNFSCVLRILLCRLSAQPTVPQQSAQHKSQCRSRQIYVDREMMFTSPYISFQFLVSLFQPRFAFLRSTGDIAPSCTVAPTILTASFESPLAPPVSSLQTVIHHFAIRSVIFRFQKVSCVFFVRSALIFFANVTLEDRVRVRFAL